MQRRIGKEERERERERMAVICKSCPAPLQYPDSHVDAVGQNEANAAKLPSEEERGGEEHQREQEQHPIIPEEEEEEEEEAEFTTYRIVQEVKGAETATGHLSTHLSTSFWLMAAK